MNQKKAFKYRFYPSDEQKRILAHTFGCCRYVYNWALRQRTDAYYQRGERLSYEDIARRLRTSTVLPRRTASGISAMSASAPKGCWSRYAVVACFHAAAGSRMASSSRKRW